MKKGSYHTKETRIKISKAMSGKNNYWWNKHLSKEHKQKLSENHADFSGKNHPMYGKHPSKKTRDKMSKNNATKRPEIRRKMSKNIKKFYKTKKGKKMKKKLSKLASEKIGKKNSMYGKENKWGHHSKKFKIMMSKLMSGRILSDETKKKLSNARKGKYTGKNSPNWLNGISFEPYGLEFNYNFKNQIRERDNFICQECKQPQKKLGYALICHHIDYNKKNNNFDNLISLCRNCHAQTNFGREDWTKYFQKMIK
jgi:hypothetical protein